MIVNEAFSAQGEILVGIGALLAGIGSFMAGLAAIRSAKAKAVKEARDEKAISSSDLDVEQHRPS